MSILGNNVGANQLKYKQEAGTEGIRNFLSRSIINNSHELDRITRYHLFWEFYNGNHWREHNHTFISFNYVRAFIDKVNQFLLGKEGFSIEVKSMETDVIDDKLSAAGEQLIMGAWNRNKKTVLCYEMLQMGSVTGDLWVLTEWDAEKKHPTIRVLDSRHSFPEFERGDVTNMKSFKIRQPLEKNNDEYVVMVTEFTEARIETWYQKDTDKDGKKFEPKSQPNTYGFIPIVHVKNRPNADSYFSISDARDIMKLNKVYNELAQELKGIIDYYIAPTTVITGGTAKSLKKGVGNIWSGLPADANVFNLGLDADLSGSTNYMAMIKTGMHELSDVPENSLGKIQAISNTSAAAIQLTYQPLIQQANMKWLTYGQGITEINKIIVQMYQKFDPENKLVKKLGADFIDKFRAEPVFPYGLPHDRMSDLQQAQMELQLKIGSRKEIMNRLGKNNVDELLLQIDDDLLRIGDISQEAQLPEEQPYNLDNKLLGSPKKE